MTGDWSEWPWEMVSVNGLEDGAFRLNDAFDIEILYSPTDEFRDPVLLDQGNVTAEIARLEHGCCNPFRCRFSVQNETYSDGLRSRMAESRSCSQIPDLESLIFCYVGNCSNDVPLSNPTLESSINCQEKNSHHDKATGLASYSDCSSCASKLIQVGDIGMRREEFKPTVKPEARKYDIWSFGCVLLDTLNWTTGDNRCCLTQREMDHLTRKEQILKQRTEHRSCTPYLGLFHSHNVLPRVRNAFLPSWNPRLDDLLSMMQILQGNGQPGPCNTYNGSAHHASRRDSALQGTCQWIFSNLKYLRWLDQSNGTLWLSGASGTGKSILTSAVSGKLQNDQQAGDLIISYFADADYKGSSPVAVIIWQILVKMLLREHRRTLPDHIRFLLSDLVNSGKNLSLTKMKIMMSVILHNLRADETMYLLLDGLDDRGDSSFDQDIINEFIDLVSLPDPKHRIKCFVATRPAFLQDRIVAGAVQSAIRVDLDSQRLNRDDLALYVRSSLLCSNLPCDPPEYEELEQKLTTEAAGSFLWVNLVLSAIRQSSGPTTALKAIRDFLSSSIPLDLENIYSTRLDQITERNRITSFSILKWVMHAVRPLHVEELRDALQLQLGIDLTGVNIHEISSGLTTSSVGQIVRFTHSTVRGFLQGQLKTGSDAFALQSHESIAETCLRKLAPERLLISLGLISEQRYVNAAPHQHSLLDYAQDHWMFHYGLAEFQSSYLTGLLHGFLFQSLEKRKYTLSPSSTFEIEAKDENAIPAHLLHLCTRDIMSILLLIAARFGFQKLAKMELDMGADMNYSFGPEKLSPLMWASINGNIDIVGLLIRYDADIHLQSSSGNSSLMYAISKGHTEVVGLLLAHGAHPQSSPGYKALLVPLRDFSLATTFLDSCTICNAVGTGFEITSLETDEGEDVLSPIKIPVEFISQTDLSNSSSINIRNDVLKVPKGHQVTRIKWFAGVKMHKALKMAARRGVEDLRKLLILAGNDIDLLERSLTMSKIMSNLRIG